jgi:phenylpropionate dioxygenase-like ring-hydroxylating dioxygenase large terminal subunit
MITHAENELLTRVALDAPMGRMMEANYWVPAVLSSRLQADGAPVRVRLFGKNYVAWRATDGRIGFFDEGCPHRQVSLALGRNEDCSLTCIFHGWKFGVDGTVLRAPTQATGEADFCKTVKLNHYRTKEGAGLVWVFLGDQQNVPNCPAFEWMDLPADQTVVAGTVLDINWMQGVEATIDSAHVGYLHEAWVQQVQEGRDLSLVRPDAPMRYEIESKKYGYSAAALRPVGDGRVLARVTEYVMPWYGLIPPNQDGQDGDHVVIIAVPVDDEHTIQWYLWFNTRRPVSAALRAQYANSMEMIHVTGNADNLWGQDRALMKAGHATGFRQLVMEDFVVELSMGAIVDRTKENLSSSDQAVVRARRLMLQAVREWSEGRKHSSANHSDIDYSAIRSRGGVITEGSNWRELPY